jgi:regulator of sigma E protease
MIIIEFIVGLAILVIIHELGHYIACRVFGISVDEFGIGFPPRLATLFEWAGTKFTLNVIPLGGFVRARGESDPSVPDGLMASNPWKRIGVYIAGPFMNILAAVGIYTLIIMRLGVEDPERLDVVMINRIEAGSPAEQAGLQVNDIILKANDQDIDSGTKLREVVYANLDVPVTLEIQRGQSVFTTELTPRSNPPPGQAPIGIAMGAPTIPVSLWVALPAGANATYRHGEALISLLTHLARGQDTGEGRLLGFKGMVDTYSTIREGDSPTGLPEGVDVLGFYTNLTISLGLLNLLPIPALDGGRVLLALPEIILRRRIPTRYQEILIGVTFLLLLGLLIFINVMEFF